MNIKEIKRKISNSSVIAKSKEYQAGYIAMRDFAMGLLNQLDEPQKPVVPEFVADWFEENKEDLSNNLFAEIGEAWEILGNPEGTTDFLRWLNTTRDCMEIVWSMQDGYEVEKEPLYMVPLLTDKEGNKKILVERRGEYDIIWDYENEDDWHELLTEEQIKSVNPDYWKLAVLYEPSEEVA